MSIQRFHQRATLVDTQAVAAKASRERQAQASQDDWFVINETTLHDTPNLKGLYVDARDALIEFQTAYTKAIAGMVPEGKTVVFSLKGGRWTAGIVQEREARSQKLAQLTDIAG